MDNEKNEIPIIKNYVDGTKCLLCGGFVPFGRGPCVCQKCKELFERICKRL